MVYMIIAFLGNLSLSSLFGADQVDLTQWNPTVCMFVCVCAYTCVPVNVCVNSFSFCTTFYGY